MTESGSRAELNELMQKLRDGLIDRREFLHALKFLGLSIGVGELISACGIVETPTPYPTAYQPFPNDPTNIALFKAQNEKLKHDLVASQSETSAGTTGSEEPVSTATPQATRVPKYKPVWLCVSCGEHFPTEEALKDHAIEKHGKRLPETVQIDQPTYAQYIIGDLARFDERNTALSRSNWDKEYQKKIMETAQKAAAQTKTPEQQWKEFEGQALIAGAIWVDDSVGVLDPSYTGYMGHQKDTGGLYGWDDPVNTTKYPVPDPAWMTERIKTVARLYGADLVGITKVNPLWIYSNYYNGATGESGPINMPLPYAIVMGIEMDWDSINTSPKLPASAATALAYSQMSELSSSLAKYIRALGYPALPCGNDTGQSIPLAIDAGLGELGRNGLLLTPEFGPRQRLCKVFTNLPLVPDKPVDFGMQKYCETCLACASTCPAKAIRKEDRTTEPTSISNREGLLRWPVNVTDCYLFWVKNGADCSNCIATCPWALRSIRDWLET